MNPMVEHPVVPEPVREEAAIGTESFLLQKRNQQRLSADRTHAPEQGWASAKRYAPPLLMMFALIPLMCLSLSLLSSTVPRQTQMIGVAGFVLLGIALVIGVGVWLRNYTPHPGPGHVIQGKVMAAEKRRERGAKNQTIETIVVRYQFTSPEGRVIEAVATAPTYQTSADMAPPAQTAVYVWYTPHGYYQLL